MAQGRTLVWFTAGPTTYDFEIIVDSPAFVPAAPDPLEWDHNDETTVGRVSFTPDQKLLMVALCEASLCRSRPGTSAIPSSAAAAARIGWTVTRFNRKLDNVCQKLADAGTRGLHGGIGRLACNRNPRFAACMSAGQQRAGSWEGMNPDVVESQARILNGLSGEIVSLMHKIEGEITSLADAWHGDDSRKFVAEWAGTHKPVFTTAATLLAEMGDISQRSAAQQRTTSSQ